MARIRSVKPELRESLLVASWDWEVRYFWVLFWGYLDDSGRGLDLPKRIAGDCFPNDDIDARDIDEWLTLMGQGIEDEQGPVCRYTVRGRRYVHAVNWREHQKPNRPTPSRLPPCQLHESLSESCSEDRNGNSVPGAAEQGSRGAGEQARSECEFVTNRTANTNASAAADHDFVTQKTGATRDEAIAVIARIAAARKPKNLPGLLRTLAAAGDLQQFLADVRRDAAKSERSQKLAAARAAPPCKHGTRGGNLPHPDSGKPICAECRHNRPATVAA